MFKRILLGLIAALFLAVPAQAQLPPGGIPSGTWARVPGAGLPAKFYYATDYGSSGSLLRSNGTRWKPVNGCTVLATLDAVSSNIPNSETIVFQYLMPANIMQSKDRLFLYFTMSKSGSTDTGSAKVRMGTAGTTSDTQVSITIVNMAAANLVWGAFESYRADSATSIQQEGPNSTALQSYTGTSNVAFGAAATISSLVTNPIYVSLSISASSTNNTVALQDAQLHLCATAN